MIQAWFLCLFIISCKLSKRYEWKWTGTQTQIQWFFPSNIEVCRPYLQSAAVYHAPAELSICLLGLQFSFWVCAWVQIQISYSAGINYLVVDSTACMVCSPSIRYTLDGSRVLNWLLENLNPSPALNPLWNRIPKNCFKLSYKKAENDILPSVDKTAWKVYCK